MICVGCGRNEDLRLGFCFDCASAGEERAAKRTVAQHVSKAWSNWRNGLTNWRYDLSWAWGRLTKTGDYRRGGPFEREYGIK